MTDTPHEKRRSNRVVAAVASLATAAALVGGGLTLSLAAHAQTSPSPSSPTQTQAGPQTPSATTIPLTEGGQGGTTTFGSSGSTTVGNRITNVNSDLALVSAQVVRENLNDTEASYVQFNFGFPVNAIKNSTGFTLQGYNVDTTISSSAAKLVQGNPNSVLAEYPAGTDVARFTLASVDTGVVVDNVNKTNVPSAAPLGGSTASGNVVTDAPALVSVRAIPTLEQVEYTFNQQIDRKTGGNASSLGFYTLDGRAVTATSAVTAVDNKVTMAFNGQVEDAVLFFAKSGAVKSARGTDSTPSSVGRPTTAPNLSAVSNLIGKTQFDFTFDRPVSGVVADHFSVYSADGQHYVAQGYVQPSADVVRVAFPQIEKFGTHITLGTADDGAAHANDGSNAGSTLGSKSIGTAAISSGKTSGPDLTSATIDNATGQVRFVFDKTVDDNKTYDAKNFSVVTQSGDIVTARSFVEVDGNTVLVTFDQPVAAAARNVTVSKGAVKDFQGQSNPIGSVRA